MKQLTCEMCGSTDLIKNDGVFVCQACGCKYSVDEARKMMVEGVVEVAGTVKVDSSASISNYFTMANNAYEAGNKAEAETYCNKIIEIDLNNYEAWFLKGKAAGWQSTIAKKRLSESVNCFSKAIENCTEDNIEKSKNESALEIANLSEALITLCCNNYIGYPSPDNASKIKECVLEIKNVTKDFLRKCDFTSKEYKNNIATKINSAVCTAWKDKIIPDYNGDDNRPSKFIWETYEDRAFACINLLKCSIDVSDSDSSSDIQRYKNLIDITTHLVNSCSWYYDGAVGWKKEWSLTEEAKQANNKNIMEYHKKIKEIDPGYVIPEKSTANKSAESGGCYIATAVYGSYECPQVWILRRYRDYMLAKCLCGRTFVRFYYAISPRLVKWFGNNKGFKKFWQKILDIKVAKLRNKGIKDTPYEDRKW